MKVRIGGVQNQVWEAIMFQTYGQYPPIKTIQYSNKAIKKLTGLTSVSVAKAKIDLVAMKMIVVTKKGNDYVEMVGINKDYDTWKLLPKKVTLPKMVKNVTKKGNALIIKKDKEYRPDSNESRLALFLFNHIKKNNPKAKEPNLNSWATSFDKIIRIDKRPIEEIKKIIEWCQKDSFWFKNILSPDKLRVQYDTLYVTMEGITPQSTITNALPEITDNPYG